MEEKDTIPNFFKFNKMKLGGEENKKLFVANPNLNNSQNKETNTTERFKFLFPDLSQQDMKTVLERAEYNIEKSIELLKEIKQEKNKNLAPRLGKKAKKRTYLESIQKIPDQPEEKNRNINNNINIGNNQEQNNNEKEPKNNDINININNNSINNNNENNNSQLIANLDEEKKNLINEQMNYLLNKFSKMKDKSELKNLLTEIGFPLIKQDPEKERIKNSELEKQLQEKLKTNDTQRKTIINLYNKYEETSEQIKQKEKKIEELSDTLVNLIDVETEQKLRKERLENELKEYESIENDNNFFNGPKEGC
jgi:hypothetical protein